MKNAMKLLSVALLVAGATQGFTAHAELRDHEVGSCKKYIAHDREGRIIDVETGKIASALGCDTSAEIEALNNRILRSYTVGSALHTKMVTMGQEQEFHKVREVIEIGRKAAGKTPVAKEYAEVLSAYFGHLLLNREFTKALCSSGANKVPEGFPGRVGIKDYEIEEVVRSLNTYIPEKSTEFFNGLLLDKKFDLARNFGQAYAMRDAALSADWLRIVTAAKEDDDRVRDATAARLVVADEKERGLAESEITLARLEAELIQARAERDRFAREKAEMIRIRKDDAERLAARANDLKRSKPPIFKAK